MTMQRACSNHQGQNTEPWSIYELHEYMTAGEKLQQCTYLYCNGTSLFNEKPWLKKTQWSVMISVLTIVRSRSPGDRLFFNNFR